jgi:LacI family transcriptional regulator
VDEITRPATISDLAAHLGVSSMTVHRAISGKPDISAKTRERILTEIERLGWRPNMAASGLRGGKTFTLGILVSNVAASFLPEILQGVNRAAEARGYHTFVSVHEHDLSRAERHLQTLQSKGVDGIVYYPLETGAAEEVELLNQIRAGTPLVAVMREVAGFGGACVVVDDCFGGELAAQHLLHLGHRRLGFLGYRDNRMTRLRGAGFVAEIREAGATVRPEWIAEDLVPGDEAARIAAERILSLPERPTALFCASDRLAARAMQAAWNLGLRVPADLSVVGYNNDPWTQLLPVPLTTVAQPREALGERAARIALDRTATEDGPQRVALRPELVVRATTVLHQD